MIQNKMTHEHAVVRCVARGDEAERAINPKFVGTADRLFESLHRFELAQDILLDLIAVSNAEIAEQGKQSSPDEVAIAQNYLLLELYHEEESHCAFKKTLLLNELLRHMDRSQRLDFQRKLHIVQDAQMKHQILAMATDQSLRSYCKPIV